MQARLFKPGLIGLGLLVIMIMVGAWFFPVDSAIFLDRALQGPQNGHLMGFDEEGRDLMKLVFSGARVSLGISIAVVVSTGLIGTLLGISAAYFGGRIDQAFIFVTDVLLAFPSILLVIALAAFQAQTSLWQVIVVLCAVGWVSYARLVRGQVYTLKQRDFVTAGRLMGCRLPRLIWRYFLPNLAGPLLVQATFGMAGVIIAESTLSFLGLGVPPDLPSWGRLLDQGVQYLVVAPHLSIFPGLAIMIAIMTFNFLGDGLRDKLDVKESVHP